MAPGPTNVPERVLRAMHRPAVELSSPAFVAMARSCIDDLKPIFRTTGEVFIYVANGHGAWEASFTNTLSPGDHLLVPETGVFSNVWADMARALGCEVEMIPSDWRHAIRPDAVAERLSADTGERIKAVLMVHTETASGVTSDVRAVREAIDSVGHPALLMVDAVASLATVEVRTDEWGIDVAVGASQKGLMTPPGLSFTAVSQRALEAHRRATMPRQYFDWTRRLGEEGYMWFSGTPPEHLLFAIREALDMLHEEGLEAIFARHQRLADAVRAAVAAWGEAGDLEINALVPEQRSNSVTTVLVNHENAARPVFEVCRDELNVSLGTGLGQMADKAFRIAHMGDCNEPMVLGALGAVETALKICSVPHTPGGVTAAVESLARAHR